MKTFFTIALLILTINSFAQISSKHPNDKGIENDTDVLFVEKFDDGLPNVLSRYDDVKNSEGMVF